MRLRTINRSGLRFALALILAIIVPWPIHSQAVPQTSASIRKIFVDKFQGDLGSAQLREGVVKSLRRYGKWQLVDRPSDDWPVADQPYHWRVGRIADPFGHHWEIGKPLART